MLRSAVKYAVKDADLHMISDETGLNKLLEAGPALLLVNRMLDGRFETHEGLQLIRRLKASHPDVSLMLISNFADSQRDAEAAGAKPGFGKSEIGSAKMRDALAGAVV
jgi:hypothetical protein